MKKNLLYLLIVAILPVLTSCEDWFDVQPKTEVKESVLFDNQEGFKRALIGVYTLMADNSSYGANGTMAFMEVLGGSYTSVKDTRNNFYEISQYDYESDVETSAVQVIKNLWSHNYSAIANINNLLENIDEKQDLFDEGMYEIIKGEALALRAFIHFDLLRNFATAPINGLEAPGIPYVDMVTKNPVAQSTVGQVLERAIADLTAAEMLLKDYDPIGPAFDSYSENPYGYVPSTDSWKAENFLYFRKERMNYYAVLGTLARVHLYRGSDGDLTEAYRYANDVISSGKIGLNESTVIADQTSSSQAMAYMAQEYLFSLFKRDLTEEVNNVYFYNNGMDNDNLAIDEFQLNAIFETEKYGGAADVRFNKLFATNQDGLNKYMAKYNYGTYDMKRVPLLKLSEMYLIIAEAVGSQDHLQTLRRARGLKSFSQGTLLQDEIHAEYRKEFVGEGQLFYYHKRLNQAINGMADVEKFIMPIPDAEIERGLIN